MSSNFRTILPALPRPAGDTNTQGTLLLKRKRVVAQVACDRCRIKKISCNGARPSCKGCIQRKTPCVYETEHNETRRMAMDRQISQLRERLEQHHDLIQHLRSAPEDEAIATIRRLRATPDLEAVLSSAGPSITLKRPSESEAARATLPLTQSRLEFELTVLHGKAYLALLPIDTTAAGGASNLFRCRHTPSPLYVSTSALVATYETLAIRPSAEPTVQSPLSRPPSALRGSNTISVPSILGPVQDRVYCDARLRHVQFGYWTSVPVSDEFAASVLSVYLENEHAIVGTFDTDMFLDDLSGYRLEFCSSFLVSALLCLASLCFSALDSRALSLAASFQKEAERLWRAHRSSDSVTTLAATITLGVATMCQGKDEISLELLADGRHMAERMRLFGICHTHKLAQEFRGLPPKQLRALSHTAWGCYSWLSVHASYYTEGPIAFPPILPVPGRPSSESTYSWPAHPQPDYLGHTFSAWCKLWTIAQEIQNLYHRKDDTRLQDTVPFAFAEQKFQNLLSWANSLSDDVIRQRQMFPHVSVLHTYYHITILDLFRPFLESPKPIQLRSFSSQDSSPKAVFDASFRQLQRVLFDCAANYDPRFFNFTMSAAVLHTIYILFQNKDTLEWDFNLSLSMSWLKELFVRFAVMGKVAQAYMTLGMDSGMITSAGAQAFMEDLHHCGRQHNLADVAVSCIVDFEVAMSSKSGGRAQQLAQKFDEMALFHEFIQSEVKVSVMLNQQCLSDGGLVPFGDSTRSRAETLLGLRKPLLITYYAACTEEPHRRSANESLALGGKRRGVGLAQAHGDKVQQLKGSAKLSCLSCQIVKHLLLQRWRDLKVLGIMYADAAIADFKDMCNDLAEVGLEVEVRPGEDESLLVFARAPKHVLRPAVYDLRIKDYLHGITSEHPDASLSAHGVDGDFEAEDLLSMYHLVNWSKANGGAAITPGFGKWKDVKSIFPIHNDAANTALLGRLSRRLLLSDKDLDRIRDLLGVKVAFYFAYMQTYFLFLFFPALTGIYAWFFLPYYSLIYAIVTLLGCTVFLEYWKIRQSDLCIRWNVRGVGHAKVNRYGHVQSHSARWKQVSRQLLQIPFVVIALLCLGAVITFVFAIEVLISEVYEGTYSFYLQYLPTILLAIYLPYINSFLEDAATALAEYENHRTQDEYDVSLSQKRFVLSFIANYLPILLTAFVYVPMGDVIVPYLEGFLKRALGRSVGSQVGKTSFHQDPDRLRNEVITLTVTGQLSDMFEELILPFIMQKLRSWYRSYQIRRSHATSFEGLAPDAPMEKSFLQSVRRQAGSPQYEVQDDISEMVIQFGYLALFSPVWPLISIGFLINNWIELRSDFLKICYEHQRPHPTRTEGIGPWVSSLETLTLLGSISTGALVHMFGASLTQGDREGSNGVTYLAGGFSWWTLPVTIIVSEHVFLMLRAVVRFMLQGVGSNLIRQEREERYARRKRHWDSLVTHDNYKSVSLSEVPSAEPSTELLVLGEPGDNKACEAGTKLIWKLKKARAETASVVEKTK
ncbi:hypothetical protein HJFPF1_08585 [Paramyrothecium foliicola]|nr:hypothetical protein HJFPF1_08585 [Paramyrothecium foliicola]